jgi:hypothetical protein
MLPRHICPVYCRVHGSEDESACYALVDRRLIPVRVPSAIKIVGDKSESELQPEPNLEDDDSDLSDHSDSRSVPLNDCESDWWWSCVADVRPDSEIDAAADIETNGVAVGFAIFVVRNMDCVQLRSDLESIRQMFRDVGAEQGMPAKLFVVPYFFRGNSRGMARAQFGVRAWMVGRHSSKVGIRDVLTTKGRIRWVYELSVSVKPMTAWLMRSLSAFSDRHGVDRIHVRHMRDGHVHIITHSVSKVTYAGLHICAQDIETAAREEDHRRLGDIERELRRLLHRIDEVKSSRPAPSHDTSFAPRHHRPLPHLEGAST